MNLVLDTSALSRLLGGEDQVIKALSNEPWDRLIIPLAVDGEIRFGFRCGNRQQENLRIYQDFLASFGVEIICPDQNTAILYADISTWCRQNGLSLSHNDLWIAATTMQAAGRLFTYDADFKQLPQISLMSH